MKSGPVVKGALSAVLLAGLAHGLACALVEGYPAYGLWRSTLRLWAWGTLPGSLIAASGVVILLLIRWVGLGVMLSVLTAAAAGFGLVKGALLFLPSHRMPLLGPPLLVSALPGAAAMLTLLLSLPSHRLRAIPSMALGTTALLVIAVVGGGSLFAGRPALPASAPDVILISIDTLRADRLGCYGYSRDTSPNLDRLASVSYRFPLVTSQATNTDPSHTCMLTGLDPPRHGNTINGDVLARRILTLPEVLREGGYQTAAVIGGTTLKARYCGLDQGFDDYDDRFPGRVRPAEEVTDRALEVISSLPEGSASFLFVHYFDVHGPYEPPPEYREFFASGPAPPGGDTPLNIEHVPRYQRIEGHDSARFYLDGYDGEIRRVDFEIGRLFDGLRMAGRDGRTWIIVLSDHGETLLERQMQFNHGALLTEEQIHVPLIVRPPGGRRDGPEVVTLPAQGTDITPFVIDVTGVAPPARLAFDGRSFRGSLSGEGRSSRPPRAREGSAGEGPSGGVPSAARPVDAGEDTGEAGRPSFAVARCVRWQLPDFPVPLAQHGIMSCVRTSRYKLVRFPSPSGTYYQLFDLLKDPGETSDVGSTNPPLVRSLATRLDSWLARGHGVPAAKVGVDQETREMLKSLGYVE